RSAGHGVGMKNSISALWSFIVAVWNRVAEGHFALIAAGVAFYAMFAVFPGLTATIAIWSMVADPGVISGYLAVAERFLPPEASGLVHDQVMGLILAPKAALGWATVISLAIAVYSARAGVSALIQGLDVVHRAVPRRWLWGWAVDFILTAALIGALMVALITVVVVPILLSYVTFGTFEAWLTSVLPWGAMFLLVLTCLSILYRFGPNVPGGFRSPWITVGVLVAALAWSGVSIGFSVYLSNFNSYNKIYGSIGAVIILMTWLYLSVWAVLLGGAINAELDERVQARSARTRVPQT
ncbi:YihY/virulence factor BrkB family protein, partial [Tabrizicola sp.]|uniref:YihY/virulence factor BrkB family protein n=1 Tax=Tabrizicola sp. TaxID=2005166 RepID=UPI00286C9D1B